MFQKNYLAIHLVEKKGRLKLNETAAYLSPEGAIQAAKYKVWSTIEFVGNNLGVKSEAVILSEDKGLNIVVHKESNKTPLKESRIIWAPHQDYVWKPLSSLCA